jgi:hypothetical protein
MNSETLHYDNARTGWFQRPDGLTDAAPDEAPWGLYCELSLGSPVRGAVMFLQHWTLQGGPHSGETHTMLYVASSNNTVFAFSEEHLRLGVTTPIWTRNLAPPSNRGGSNINHTGPESVGVASTVVLDSARRRLFVVALTSVAPPETTCIGSMN